MRSCIGKMMLGAGVALASVAPATTQAVTLTSGVTLNWDAALDQNGNQFLDSSLQRADNRRWNFGSAAALNDAKVDPGDITGAPGIRVAIDMPVAGIGGSMTTLDANGLNVGGNKTTQPATFELIATFDNLTGKHVLFESGGNGQGTAFFIDGNQLSFQAQSVDNPANRATVTLTQTDLNKVVHLVGTIDTGTGTVTLYKDGVNAGSSTAASGITDWTGGDNAGLGTIGGGSVTGGSEGTYTAFDGKIAALRYYRDKALTQAEVDVNYAYATSREAQSLYQWDAGLDPDGGTDGTWQEANRLNSLGGERDLTLDNSVTFNGSATSAMHSDVTGAYVFDGSGGARGTNFEQALDNPTDASASFEILFKADDLIGQEMLWEIGGAGDGVSLTLNDDVLQFVAKDGGVSASLSGLATNDDFVRVLAVIDLENDMLQLIINDMLVSTTAYTGNDWAGNNQWGLGITNDSPGGSDGALGNLDGYGGFEGEIALFRFYSFAATVPEPATAGLGILGAAGLLMRRRRGA